MTTAAEIKALTAELRERDPRLVLMGRWLVLRPCTHWISGLYFDRTSYREHFTVNLLVLPLYRPIRDIWFATGRQVRPPLDRGVSGGWWNHTWPNCDRVLTDLTIQELLPEVERAASVETYRGFLRQVVQPWGLRDHHILTLALQGKLRQAARMARRYATEVGMPVFTESDVPRRRTNLAAIFESGQERTNRVLRTFERTMARRFGVEKFWSWEPVVGS
jgi:hypothetical protein